MHAVISKSYQKLNIDHRSTIFICFTDFRPVAPPDGHEAGGLPMISDSAFSLVILLYVSVAFVFVFFMFCWRSSEAGANGKKGIERQFKE